MSIEIIKLFVVLLLILVFLKLKIDLWLNLLINSLLIGLMFKLKMVQILVIYRDAAKNFRTIELLTIIIMIYCLSIIMEKLNKYEEMMNSLQKIIPDYRFAMIFLSSFIGLLPIQGGAIFSAPMVKKLGERNHNDSEKNMFVNYWFRHVWEFAWPLYPEVILYASLLKISVKDLIVMLFPLAIIAFLIGIIWIYKNLFFEPFAKKGKQINFKAALKDFVKTTWPILLAVSLTLIFNTSLMFSLFIVLILLFFFYSDIRKQIGSILNDVLKESYKTLLLIYSIFAFQGILEYSKIIEILPELLIVKNFSIHAGLIILPAIVSFFTGSMLACVGICVPIFLGFLVNPNGTINISQVILLYLSGFTGMMVTPIHLCLAITKDFFNVRINNFYYTLVFNISVFYGLSLVYSFIRSQV